MDEHRHVDGWTQSPEPMVPRDADASLAEYGPSIDRTGPLSGGPLAAFSQWRSDVFSALVGRGPLVSAAVALRSLTHFMPRASWWSGLSSGHRSLDVDPFGADPAFFESAEGWLEFLYAKYWRVETLGLSNIPSEGRALLVANHSGTVPFDATMLIYAVHRDHRSRRLVRPLVEDAVFHFPFIGAALNRLGGVRACQDNAMRLLDSGQLAAVFPEGIQGMSKPFAKRYQLQRFGRGGFVKLALRTRTPIIPVAVVGAEEVYPMLTKWTRLTRFFGVPYLPVTPTFPWLGLVGTIPLPSKWVIWFGDPIRLHEIHAPDSAEDRILVNRLTESIRSTVQNMVDEALSERRSAFHR